MDNSRLIRLLTLTALAITLVLQGALWFGDGSLMHIHQLKKQIAVQQGELGKLKARNEILEAQVRSLKGDLDSVEGLARSDLGMIRQGETFFMVTDPDRDDAKKGESTDDTRSTEPAP